MRDLKFALRSLARAKGLSATVILTLALGIGANASIFSVVRGVLLRPLVNRDEKRLMYIRQSALGIGTENAAFVGSAAVLLVVAVLGSLLPAARAARVDVVQALRAE